MSLIAESDEEVSSGDETETDCMCIAHTGSICQNALFPTNASRISQFLLLFHYRYTNNDDGWCRKTKNKNRGNNTKGRSNKNNREKWTLYLMMIRLDIEHVVKQTSFSCFAQFFCNSFPICNFIFSLYYRQLFFRSFYGFISRRDYCSESMDLLLGATRRCCARPNLVVLFF